MTGAFTRPLPPTTSPHASTTIPVVQPYVGSPPTSGAAFTARRAPMTWLASSLASSWPSAFSTGAAAFFAAASPTGVPSADGALHSAPFPQLSVRGA